MSNTKVTYLKNDKVKLVVDLEDYRKLLKGNNDLQSAVSMMHECHTIYLEDLGKLEVLSWKMAESLGFCQQEGGGHYYGNYVLSNDSKAKKEKK